MEVTLKLSVLLALAVVLTLAFGHDVWAGFFSDSRSIIKKFAEMTPLLAVSIAIDAIQGILSGSNHQDIYFFWLRPRWQNQPKLEIRPKKLKLNRIN